MRLLDKLRMRLRMLFNRKRELQRLDAELSFHLEQQTDENIARGMGAIEARQAALRALAIRSLCGSRRGKAGVGTG